MVIQLTKHQDLLLRMAEIKSSRKRDNFKNAHVSCQEKKKHVLVTFSARPNLLTLNTATLKMFVSQDINTRKSIKLVKLIKKRKNDSSSMIDKGTGKKKKKKKKKNGEAELFQEVFGTS